MKKEFNEVWKAKIGSQTWWYVQGKKGRLSFKRKKDAVRWAELIKKEMSK